MYQIGLKREQKGIEIDQKGIKNRLNRAKDSIFDQTIPVFWSKKLQNGGSTPLSGYFLHKNKLYIWEVPLCGRKPQTRNGVKTVGSYTILLIGNSALAEFKMHCTIFM